MALGQWVRRHTVLLLRSLATTVLFSIVAIPAGGEEPAATRAPGTLTADTSWEGSVIVDVPLTVSSGATLTLLPGATLRFKGDGLLTVLGTLRAEGTAEQPVAVALWERPRAPGA